MGADTLVSGRVSDGASSSGPSSPFCFSVPASWASSQRPPLSTLCSWSRWLPPTCWHVLCHQPLGVEWMNLILGVGDSACCLNSGQLIQMRQLGFGRERLAGIWLSLEQRETGLSGHPTPSLPTWISKPWAHHSSSRECCQ